MLEIVQIPLDHGLVNSEKRLRLAVLFGKELDLILPVLPLSPELPFMHLIPETRFPEDLVVVGL